MQLVIITNAPIAINIFFTGTFPTNLAAIGAASSPPTINPATSRTGMLFTKIKNEMEMQADAFAASTLVDQKALRLFLNNGVISAITLQAFAKSQGVAPSIVLGQLQHRKLVSFSSPLNKLKKRFVWNLDKHGL